MRVVQLHRSHVLSDNPHIDKSTGIKELLSKRRPFNTHDYPTVLSTEVIYPSDHRTHAALFYKAKYKKVSGLLNRVAFQIVQKATLTPNANIMGGRFDLATKKQGTKDELYRGRVGFTGSYGQGEEPIRPYDQYGKTAFHPPDRKPGGCPGAHSVVPGNLPGLHSRCRVHIARTIYVGLVPEFQFDQSWHLQIRRPLYGLTKAGD